MYYALAVVLVLIGLFAGGLGLAAAADPEGRGENFFPLVPLGLLIVVFAMGWLLYLGYMDIRALPFFRQ